MDRRLWKIGLPVIIIAILSGALWWIARQSSSTSAAWSDFIPSYAPDTPAQTQHDVTVRLLQVAHSLDATVLQVQITAPPGMSEGQPAGGQDPILYDNLGHVYLHPHDATPQINKTILSAPASASNRISFWQDIHAPLSELARSLTYVIPELAFHTPVHEELTLNMGERPLAGQTWSLDKTFQVAGVQVHLSHVRLIHNVAQQRYELALEAESDLSESSRLQLLDIQSPELPRSMISGDLHGRIYARLFTASDRPPTGLIHIQITGAEISIMGPWRFQWDIPGRSHDHLGSRSRLIGPVAAIIHTMSALPLLSNGFRFLAPLSMKSRFNRPAVARLWAQARSENEEPAAGLHRAE